MQFFSKLLILQHLLKSFTIFSLCLRPNRSAYDFGVQSMHDFSEAACGSDSVWSDGRMGPRHRMVHSALYDRFGIGLDRTAHNFQPDERLTISESAFDVFAG